MIGMRLNSEMVWLAELRNSAIPLLVEETNIANFLTSGAILFGPGTCAYFRVRWRAKSVRGTGSWRRSTRNESRTRNSFRRATRCLNRTSRRQGARYAHRFLLPRCLGRVAETGF